MLLANVVLIFTFILYHKDQVKKSRIMILLCLPLFFINLLIAGFFIPIIDFLPEPNSAAFAGAVTFGLAALVTLLEVALFYFV